MHLRPHHRMPPYEQGPQPSSAKRWLQRMSAASASAGDAQPMNALPQVMRELLCSSPARAPSLGLGVQTRCLSCWQQATGTKAWAGGWGSMGRRGVLRACEHQLLLHGIPELVACGAHLQLRQRHQRARVRGVPLQRCAGPRRHDLPHGPLSDKKLGRHVMSGKAEVALSEALCIIGSAPQLGGCSASRDTICLTTHLLLMMEFRCVLHATKISISGRQDAPLSSRPQLVHHK